MPEVVVNGIIRNRMPQMASICFLEKCFSDENLSAIRK